VVGDGLVDLVVVPGLMSHLELIWESPEFSRFVRRLSAFARVILFDKRGTGLSDRLHGIATLEERMDDVRAVMDAAGVERAALCGVSEGGCMSMLFAATYPDRASALVLIGSFARFVRADDYPWGLPPRTVEAVLERIGTAWGDAAILAIGAPSRMDDAAFRAYAARYERMGASPGAALDLIRMNTDIDVRHVLPSIRVPTLVMHVSEDRLVLVGNGRYLAEHIPGAKYVEIPGTDHVLWLTEPDVLADGIQEFLTGSREVEMTDRVLSTLLFTDIVESTECAARLGDRRWRELLERHHTLVRTELAKYRGIEIDTAGDGFLASFDGPARGIRCGVAIRNRIAEHLRLGVRIGVHTGECERLGDRLSGIAVHIGARVAAAAAAGEILVSSTVKDLVAGSGIVFEDRGAHALKGVPGTWRIYSVSA
jgi:pimeloyl-ACP methyl ester carboxylesterase